MNRPTSRTRPALAIAADENFDGRILRGLERRLPDLDYVRIQDTPLEGAGDPEVLEWAAQQGRVLLTHDAKTIPSFVADRRKKGLTEAGVVVVRRQAPIGAAVEDLELLLMAGEPEDVRNQVLFLPFPRSRSEE